MAEAQSNLGGGYAEGVGVPKDPAEAVKWIRKAADQGLAGAQSNLGTCYANGVGVRKDPTEAVKWYRKAAEQGNVDAQAAVGARYVLGDGVLKDYVEGHKWINLASAQGLDVAKKSLTTVELLMTPDQIAEAQKLAREFKPRTVHGPISGESGVRSGGPASGTGFFITEDGFLITNEHVIRDAAQVRLVTSAGLISAKVVKVDVANDLALLKAEGQFSPLPVAASRGVKLGGTVATVGFPNIGLQGFATKLAKGEIASLSGAQDDARHFQISVPVQPGNSGGALVDERGNVVGVVSAKLNARAALSATGALPENVNYSVKSIYLLSFLESVPEVSAKLKEPETKELKFEDVVKSSEQAAVLVLVY
jgi:S1-C subfamily serine protease